MGNDKRLHVTVRKENYLGETGGLVKKLVPLLTKYRSITIDMQGFKCGELLEAIRPLSNKNVWATIMVYSGEKRDPEAYDEEVTVP
ncbi:MAG: hypothetical protein FGF48_06020 [Candidatus Brockarchaeota archaeon]|nr:hypothetical protein [Candidatus Brockarchaeota archaeon]MBO3841956.1 hypothetical protein [Candidatus Brockarchaeota archaeon]